MVLGLRYAQALCLTTFSPLEGCLGLGGFNLSSRSEQSLLLCRCCQPNGTLCQQPHLATGWSSLCVYVWRCSACKCLKWMMPTSAVPPQISAFDFEVPSDSDSTDHQVETFACRVNELNSFVNSIWNVSFTKLKKQDTVVRTGVYNMHRKLLFPSLSYSLPAVKW